MTSITLTSPPASARREKVAAGLALPLGTMTCVGGIVFWEWSALTWIAVIALAMGASYVVNAVRLLRGDPAAARFLMRTAYVGIAFSLAKLAIWEETEAVIFGVVAAVIAVLLGGRERRAR
jgi:cation transport ATPase